MKLHVGTLLVVVSLVSLINVYCRRETKETVQAEPPSELVAALKEAGISVDTAVKLPHEKLMDVRVHFGRIIGYSTVSESFVELNQTTGNVVDSVNVGRLYQGHVYDVTDTGFYFPTYGDNQVEFAGFSKVRDTIDLKGDPFYVSGVKVIDDVMLVTAMSGVYFQTSGGSARAFTHSCASGVGDVQAIRDSATVYVIGMRSCDSDGGSRQFGVVAVGVDELNVLWSVMIPGTPDVDQLVVGDERLYIVSSNNDSARRCTVYGIGKKSGQSRLIFQSDGDIARLAAWNDRLVFSGPDRCLTVAEPGVSQDHWEVIECPFDGQVFTFRDHILVWTGQGLGVLTEGGDTIRIRKVAQGVRNLQVVPDGKRGRLLINDLLVW